MCAMMEMDTFENPFAVFDRFSVDHKNNYNQKITRTPCVPVFIIWQTGPR